MLTTIGLVISFVAGVTLMCVGIIVQNGGVIIAGVIFLIPCAAVFSWHVEQAAQDRHDHVTAARDMRARRKR